MQKLCMDIYLVWVFLDYKSFLSQVQQATYFPQEKFQNIQSYPLITAQAKFYSFDKNLSLKFNFLYEIIIQKTFGINYHSELSLLV